jgi:hypothetical protein
MQPRRFALRRALLLELCAVYACARLVDCVESL